MISWILLAGCASTHKTVDINRSAFSERSDLGCRVHVSEIVDSVGPRTFRGPGGDTWRVPSITERIRQQITEWQPENTEQDDSIELWLELVRAYSDPKTWQIYFHTVLFAKVDRSEGEFFRGTFDATSWFGNEEEFTRALHRSLDEALGKLHGWLSSRCAQS